ncbi:uncharacterized protein LOC143186255 [Calliopsis andreniformis]|uniref:uncharacterized protein LOC143186255 n=1 Tax=Calliopsis andreniformis TaxID=337506 RepID=UPI003FCE0FD5
MRLSHWSSIGIAVPDAFFSLDNNRWRINDANLRIFRSSLMTRERGDLPPLTPSAARVVAALIQTTRLPPVLFTIDGSLASARAPDFKVADALAPYFWTTLVEPCYLYACNIGF